MKYRLLIIWLSCKWMFRITLGDLVWYQGKRYVVCNGVRDNQWQLSDLGNSHDGWVARKDCRKCFTIPNMLGSFRSGYRFYMANWYAIWKREGVKPWMKGCNIWR